jgi:GTP-binding protein
MAELVAAARAAAPAVEATRIVLRPPSADGGDDFTVLRTDDGGWRVRGAKPERWVRQTDFSNDEAVGFLADRLDRLGVEAELLRLGAPEGEAVLIGRDDNSVVFDFKPSVAAGAEMLGRRGEDQRFEESRPARRRRREIDEAMDEREEGETRADVARRVREQERADRPAGPTSYEIGGADDPDWLETSDED